MATQFEPQAQRLAARDIVSARRNEASGPRPAATGVKRSGMSNIVAAIVVFVLGAGGVIAYQPLAQMAGSLLSGRVIAKDPHALIEARFTLCTVARQQNCVLDGNTLRFSGTTVRIADIDAPEILSPECPAELTRGNKATKRLLQLVNAGPFQVSEAGGEDRDAYGRALRLIVRDGRSVGATLVAEGLARTSNGAPRGWC